MSENGSAISALGYAHINEEQAWRQLDRALQTNDFTLPLDAIVLYKLQKISPQPDLLGIYYQQILSRHQYLYEHCDPQDNGLPHHPEAAPNIPDITFLTALTWSNESLIKLGHQLDADVLEVIQWHELTIFSMNEQFWDESCGGYHQIGAPKEANFMARFLPLAGEIPTQDQAECMLLKLESRLSTGDIRVFDAWMLYNGLLRYDFENVAAKLRRRILHCCEEYGFCEGFNLESGKPLTSPRQQSPLVAALILDLLQK